MITEYIEDKDELKKQRLTEIVGDLDEKIYELLEGASILQKFMSESKTEVKRTYYKKKILKTRNELISLLGSKERLSTLLDSISKDTYNK